MPPLLSLRLFLLAVYALAVMVVVVAVPVLAWRTRPLPAPARALGVKLSAAVLVLQIPGVVAYTTTFDPRPLLEDEVSAPMKNLVAPELVQSMLVAALVSALVMAVWRVFTVPAAVAVHDDEAFPAWLGEATVRWLFAAAVGLGLGVASLSLSLATGPGSDDIARQAPDLFPQLPTGLPRWLLAASSGLAGAIASELSWRGVLQRALLRWLPPVGAIALTATLVACGQAFAPQEWGLAVLQAGLAAAVLGTLAHRQGLEASIVAHGIFAVVSSAIVLFP